MGAHLIRGVIWDIDGTLLDSNDAHARAYVEASEIEAVPVTFDQVRPLIGMGSDRLFPAAFGISENSEIGRRVSRHKKSIFQDRYFASLRPFPGAAQLVKALDQRGYCQAIATSAGPDELKQFLELIGIEKLIKIHTSKKDVDHSKPNPEVVNVALERARLRAHEAIMIGDTPYDVAAALKAGVRPIAFRCGGWWQDADFEGAAAIYGGPADLLARLQEWPTLN